MDDQVLAVFASEVGMQCQFIIVAAHNLDAALVTHNRTETWMHLQTMLVASANLSKMFWGSSGKKEAERERLREAFQVKDDSPLRDPDLRNDFEHFDTRLETWFGESEHHNYVGRNIGPPSAITGVDTAERFQQFDPDTGVVAFWEHSVSLKDLIVEAARIHQMIPPLLLPR